MQASYKPSLDQYRERLPSKADFPGVVASTTLPPLIFDYLSIAPAYSPKCHITCSLLSFATPSRK